MRLTRYVFLLFLLSLTVFGCKKKKTDVNLATSKTSVIINEDTVEKIVRETDTVANNGDFMMTARPQSASKQCKTLQKFNLPNPVDLLFQSDNFKTDVSFVLPISEYDRLQTSTAKANLLGIYSADMVYCFVMQDHELMSRYFEVINKLVNDIGLTKVITSDDIKKLESSADTDTVKNTIKNVLTQMCISLENNNFVDVLPFVVYSTWLESNYLIVSYLYNIQSQDIFFKRLKQQPETIDNMEDFLNDALTGVSTVEISKKIQALQKDLYDIDSVYNAVYRQSDLIVSKDNLKTMLDVLSKARQNLLKDK